MNLPRVFVSTPSHDGRVLLPYHVSAMNLASSGVANFVFSYAKGGGISVARNHAAHEFLNTKSEYLLTIDGDLRFGPEHLARLLSHNKDVVGAVYGHKYPGPLKLSGNALPGAAVDETTGLLEVRALGTGFLLVKREVMEAISDKLFYSERYRGRGEYEGQILTNIYGMGVCDRDKGGIGEHVTEDFMFARHARSCGYKVYCDTRFYLPHIGDIEYPTIKPEEVGV